jgi:hypothetical protein
MSVFKPIKATSLPGTPAPDAVYFIKAGSSAIVRIYVTDSTGTAYLVGQIVDSPFTPTNTAVTVGDTFQTIAEKLQGQVTNIAQNYLQLAGGTMTGYISLHADPTQAFHAATKQYVDNVAEGLHIHASVKVATTTTLASSSGGTVTYNNGTNGLGATLTLSNALTQLDGYSLVNGDRVLIKNETNKAHNGLYVRTSSTVFTRASDYDTVTEIKSGDFVFVSEGVQGGKTGWVQISSVSTIGTDIIEWQQFSGAGTYVGSTSIVLNANSFERAALIGDVTSAQNSNTLTIANNAVSNEKFRQSAGFSVVGRTATGTGNVADIVAGTDGVLRRSGSGDLAFGTLVTNNVGDSQITYAKIQNVTADRILGRITTTGVAQELTATQVRTLLNVADGANNYVLPTATSTVLGGIEIFSDTVQSVASNAVSATASRTYGIQLNSSGQAVVNVPWANTEYTGSTSIILTGGSFERAALTGDVTSAQNSNATTIASKAVTYAKIQDVATSRMLGRVTAGAGVVEELTASQVRSFLNVADGANNYVHPSYTPINSTLTGATVVASLTTDAIGSVTGFTTRTLTLADIGADNYSSWLLAASGTAGTASITSGATVTLTAGTGMTVTRSSNNVTFATTITQYTDALARTAISLTTTGTSGAATYDNSTGVLNIPQYQAVLTNPVTGTGVDGQVSFWTGTGTQAGDNGLFWDNINKRLGIGTTSPRVRLEVSDDLIISKSNVWTARTTPNDGYQRIAYGNGLFVAIGTTTNFITSPDGINWTTRTAPSATWLSITYGNGLFVAVSTSNIVATSPDGITWTSRTNASSRVWRGVTYGNGLFVAVASSVAGNRVATSPDGITWTSRTTPADNDWWAVTYGNGLFVAVSQTGTGNRVMTSPDGITWTLQTSASDSTWNDITYGKGLFVACANNAIMTSPDGITWTSRTPPTTNNYHGITYGNGLFVTVNTLGGANGAATSIDGITWVVRSLPASNQYRGIAYGNGLFVAVSNTGTNNRVATSGAVEQTLPTPINRLNGDWYYTGNLIVGAITDSGGQRVQVVGNTELGNSILQTFSGVASASMRINSGGNLLFGLDTSTGATERARITSNGRVLIGTTTESTQLFQVAGTVALRASSTASAATQIPVFTADPASTTRELVTRTPAQLLTDIGAGASTADITGVTLTSSTLTLTRASGNLTASVPTFNQNTTGSAATLTTAQTFTIGSAAGKTFNGSAGLTWTLNEIGAAATVHTHVVSDIVSLTAKRLIGRHTNSTGAGEQISLANNLAISDAGVLSVEWVETAW